MATGTIKRPTGVNTITDVSNSFITQNYYSIINSEAIEITRNNNLVMIRAVIRCDDPYATNPGIKVLSGVAPPPSRALYFPIPPYGSASEAFSSLRVAVMTNGDINLRWGTTNRDYAIVITYICA